MKKPKYQLIKDDIISQIKSEKLKPGDKVESESVLKRKYNVSAITVRKAFSELINDGYLVGIQGSGTFVAKKQMIRALTSLSFSEELKQQGYETHLIIDSVGDVNNSVVASFLGLKEEDTLTCVRRVRFANGEPVAYHTSWIDSSKVDEDFPKLIQEADSLYQAMEKYSLFPHMVNENYTVHLISDPHICKMLNVKKNDAGFFVKRTTFDAFGNTIEYAETYFNKDFYSVTVNIKV